MQGRAPWKRYGRADATEVGDKVEGAYTREQLLAMDVRFIERVERAISDGLERRPDQPNAITSTARASARTA